jgi:RND superfamily putative drug exporter
VITTAASKAGATQNGLSGPAASSYDISTTADNDLIRIIPIALAVIGLLLVLVLRSLVAPLYLIPSVVLSYLAALGIATILFLDVLGSTITFMLPFLMFVFLVALGEDYNILMMTRIRHEAAKGPLSDAVRGAVAATGSTITSAGIILGGTFAVLAIASSGPTAPILRPIGTGLAVGVLLDTFLVRTLLIPSTVLLLGRWNWWPSSLARVRVSAPAAVAAGQAQGYAYSPDVPATRVPPRSPAADAGGQGLVSPQATSHNPEVQPQGGFDAALVQPDGQALGTPPAASPRESDVPTTDPQ